MRTLRFILGDQLTRTLASLRDLHPSTDVVLMTEVQTEATYVPHHAKKIAFIFSAMRHFAAELREDGISIDYVALDDPSNCQSFRGELMRAIARHRPDRIVVTAPGEYRVCRDMAEWEAASGVRVEIREDDRFFCTREAFSRWIKGRRGLRMEQFYRYLRRREALLMTAEGCPVGERWNFDAENRKPLKGAPPPPLTFKVDPDEITREVLGLVAAEFPDHFGDLEPFEFAVTKADAERAFAHFRQHALPHFGDYQDAMKLGEHTLFHSLLSVYLNAGLLDPRTLCREVERDYYAGRIPINAAEGFIRQVLGWREFIRGVYWSKMPAYAETNFFNAYGPLPSLYWTGATDMRCLAECVAQTKRHAYAHHIQRLMVTGNFAMLAGVTPKEISDWYLIVYADAYEWVELPNVIGMALYADGGLLASKPYAASGKYINRMSDYCQHCRYQVKDSIGAHACPFNYLYWNFLVAHRGLLGNNPRMRVIYASLDKMPASRIAAMRAQAAAFLNALA